MTARGWGSSRQTLRKAENSTAAGLADGAPEQRPLDGRVEPVPVLEDVGNEVPGAGTGKRCLARLGIEHMQKLRAELDEEKSLRGDSVGGSPFAPVRRIDLDLEVDEARSQGRRHAVGNAAVALAVAAGHERGAFGELVLTDPAVENELVQGGLDHGHRGRELLEVDEEALVGVRGGQERRGRPAGALVERLGDRLVALDDGGHVGGDALVAALLQDDLGQHGLQHVHRAPGDAAQIHGVEQQRAHVDVEAPEGRGDLPDDVALGAAGRAPDHDRLSGFDKDS